MWIRNCVLDELQRSEKLRYAERAAYFGAWMYEPKSTSELARLLNMDRSVAARACGTLVEENWMRMIPYRGVPMPVAVIPHSCQRVMAKELYEEYRVISLKGEYLANKRLDWLLRNDEYIRNARPDFLRNPQTDKPMEYDRYDPKNRFASEFNGTQHHKASKEYNEETVKEQQARDLMKESLSARNGVTLLVVTPGDLRPGILEKRINTLVPHLKRAYVDMKGPYVIALNKLCNNYANMASQ